MPDLISTIVLVGGLSTFFLTLLYLRAYLRYERTVRDSFAWREDPRVAGDTQPKKSREEAETITRRFIELNANWFQVVR